MLSRSKLPQVALEGVLSRVGLGATDACEVVAMAMRTSRLEHRTCWGRGAGAQVAFEVLRVLDRLSALFAFGWRMTAVAVDVVIEAQFV